MRTELRGMGGRGGGSGVWLSLCVIPRVVYGVLGSKSGIGLYVRVMGEET